MLLRITRVIPCFVYGTAFPLPFLQNGRCFS